VIGDRWREEFDGAVLTVTEYPKIGGGPSVYDLAVLLPDGREMRSAPEEIYLTPEEARRVGRRIIRNALGAATPPAPSKDADPLAAQGGQF